MRLPLLIGSLAAGTLIIAGVIFAAKVPSYTPRQDAADSGAMTGRVLDEDGQPVAGAEVYANRGGSPMGRLPRALSDERGEFSFRDLVPGTYTLHASQDRGGYLRTDSAFHLPGYFTNPQASVTERQTVTDVEVRVGPRGAKLRGTITDLLTGGPVKGAQITLRRVDNPDYSYSTGPNLKGDFDIIVPPEPFTIEVSEPGHEVWAHNKGDLKPQGEPLKLSPGETKKLIIRLRPGKQP